MRRGILADRDELRELSRKITKRPFDGFYARLVHRCDLVLESQPVTEHHWRSSWEHGNWASALHAAQDCQGRLFDLLIAHHIDRNLAYRDRAVEELRNLARWSTWVDPSHPRMEADLCTGEAATAAAVGLDWLWEDLSETERASITEAILAKAIRPYLRDVEQGRWWYECYHNWNAVVNGGVGLAALALSDDSEEAQCAYHLARDGLKQFLHALGNEGGWDEGTGYWGFGMRFALLMGEAMRRLADDQRVFRERGMAKTGLFPVHFCPHAKAASFGDNASVPLLGSLYLLSKYFDVPELTWWLDTYLFESDVKAGGRSKTGLAILFRPSRAKGGGVKKLPNVKVFREIGWASLADSWPKPGFYVAAKTGDLSANHSQHDMNSIQLQVDGEMLLTDQGHPPYTRSYFSERRSEFYEVQARAHNTITVAEEDHRIDARGEIVGEKSAANYRWVACDAGEACGENVRFLRHVVMLMDRDRSAGSSLVVVDELANGVPERVDLFWHTRGHVHLSARPKPVTGTITGQWAKLNFAVHTTVPGQTTVEVHELATRRPDHVLRTTAGVSGRAEFVSVFSRDKIPDNISVERDDGRLIVTIGETSLTFRSHGDVSELKSVRGG
ncbi:MAG: heparinase II/III domain-containing protein [Phycisphaerae bacterium]